MCLSLNGFFDPESIQVAILQCITFRSDPILQQKLRPVRVVIAIRFERAEPERQSFVGVNYAVVFSLRNLQFNRFRFVDFRLLLDPETAKF